MAILFEKTGKILTRVALSLLSAILFYALNVKIRSKLLVSVSKLVDFIPAAIVSLSKLSFTVSKLSFSFKGYTFLGTPASGQVTRNFTCPTSKLACPSFSLHFLFCLYLCSCHFLILDMIAAVTVNMYIANPYYNSEPQMGSQNIQYTLHYLKLGHHVQCGCCSY